jgi:hypothetical protein
MTNPTSSEGECPHCGKEFDHLPAHQWQCPEKPEENEESDEPDDSENDIQENQTSDESSWSESPTEKPKDQNKDSQNSSSNAGVIVDQVKPDEKDTRKNKDESEPEENDDSSDWVELDYNDGKQVKTILETTDVSEPRDAQKLLKAFKTGEADDIPKFSEIRLSDGELR